jgi:polyphosphate kinase
MMHRNLDRRVEALVRLADPGQIEELESLFDQALDPATASWWLGEDGEWTRHSTEADGAPLADLQSELMTQIAARGKRASTLR